MSWQLIRYTIRATYQEAKEMEIIKKLEGKKSTIALCVIVVAVVLQNFGITIPDGVWQLLGLVFGGTMLDKFNRIAGKTAELKKDMEDIKTK